MTSEAMDRERQLIEEIQAELPGFVDACRADAEFVVMNQDAFAPMLGNGELLLLGKAVKYVGLVGKELRIVPTPRRPGLKVAPVFLARNRGGRLQRFGRETPSGAMMCCNPAVNRRA